MSFFDDLKRRGAELRQNLETEFAKFKNRDVLEALMGACAYVAAADGHIDPEEKRKMVGYVKTSPVTNVYGVDLAIKAFNEHASRFEFDFEVGKAEALRVIGKYRGKSEVARMIIRAAIIIGNSDGNFDAHEKAAVRTIARELDENPADFDL